MSTPLVLRALAAVLCLAATFMVIRGVRKFERSDFVSSGWISDRERLEVRTLAGGDNALVAGSVVVVPNIDKDTLRQVRAEIERARA